MRFVRSYEGFAIRPGNAGRDDIYIIGEVWNNDIYGIMECEWEPETILDIGANIGMFSAIAHKRWPKARITAVEPNPELIDVLNENVGEFAVIIHAALSDKPQTFIAPNDHASCTGTTDAEREDAVAVRGMTLAEILDEANMPRCGLLQFDCEGCEYKIDPAHLERVDKIMGEYHSGMVFLPDGFVYKLVHGGDEIGVFHAWREGG